MAQVIKIKRSSSTATPSTLAQGELAYSAHSTSNKLFIGNPGTGDVTVVGGKFFTDMLDHTAGTLTASSAIIVDSSSKIDVLNVDNLTFDGNSITSTDTNGDLNLTPNGTGDLVLDGTNWPQTAGTNGYVLTTDGTGQSSWSAPASSSFTLNDGTNTDTFNTGETLTFTGGTDITTTVSDNTVTFAYSGKAPAIYDNSGNPALETGITAAEVRTLLGVDAAGTDNYGGEAPAIYDNAGTPALKVGITAGEVRTLIGVDEPGTDNYGGEVPAIYDNSGTPALATGITALEVRTLIGVDAAGTDNSTDVTLETSNHDYLSLSGQEITLGAINLGTDVTGTLPNAGLTNDSVTIGTTEINLGSSQTDIAGLTSLGVTGAVTIGGNLTVTGTTTTVNSETLTINDNIITLNNNATGVPSENAGIEVERGTSTNVQLRWNETTDTWQTTVDGTNYYNLITSENFEAEFTNIDGGTF